MLFEYCVIGPNKRIFLFIMTTRLSSRTWKRTYCTYKHALSSQHIRSRFLDYFVKEKDHVLVKSTPVASYFDPTIPFINAGMCQFKRVFTGEEEINYDKATNTQKCIRIGGKHNDLNLVGVDSYHHTFFEMLGNWSFGSYNKKEACTMAWYLLTSAPYSISPNRLFVTYFGGDEKLNLPADDEVREIWLQLGISSDRILPFGINENFWEMGPTGPCGTCTEIHVAFDDEISSRSDLVNKNNPLLAELWNIVFIKFNKTENSLEKLPKEFIDTGMGFERLTTLLQEKTSNYDTDLFIPLLDKISEVSRAPKYSGSFNSNNLDNSYRCLADFSRMITFAISDNVFPDLNPKLRRVLRKALYLAKYKFDINQPSQLLSELSNQLAEIYHGIFPEIGNNLQKVRLIVENEDELVQKMTNQSFQNWNHKTLKYPVLESFSFIEYPGLLVAFDFLMQETKLMKKDDYIPAKLVHYLYDTHGLDQPVIEKLLNKLQFRVNWKEFEEFLGHIKDSSRSQSLSSMNLFRILQNAGIQTDNSLVYSFSKNNGIYSFPEIKAKLLAVVEGDTIRSVAKLNDQLASVYPTEVKVDYDDIGLIFDKSNFYGGENGTCHDIGDITILAGDENVRFKVAKVKTQNNIVVHFVKPYDNESHKVLKSGTEALLKISASNRVNIMRNYTAIHLLIAALKEFYPLMYLKNSFIVTDHFRIICRVLGRKFSYSEDKYYIEKRLAKFISDGLSVERTIIPTAREIFSLPNIAFSPGMIYPPSNIQAVTFVDRSGKTFLGEFCCGIHLLNSEDLKKFEIISFKRKESGDLHISCHTGDYVRSLSAEEDILKKDSLMFADRVRVLLNNDAITIGEIIDLNDELSMYLYRINHELKNKKLELSVSTKNDVLLLTSLQSDLAKRVKKFSRESVTREISSRIHQKANNRKFVVHLCLLNFASFFHESFQVDIIVRNNVPTILIHYANKKLSAVCYVPNSWVTEEFNAAVWLKAVAEKFSFCVSEEDEMINICLMKRKILEKDFYELIGPFMETSANIAKQFLE